MRICIRGRIDDQIEADDRLSKFNFDSRSNYFINVVMLEKRLIHDVAVRDRKQILYDTSDLKAHYDRQLLSIGCMVQELVSVSRAAAKNVQRHFQ